MFNIKVTKKDGMFDAKLTRSDGPDIEKLIVRRFELFYPEGIEEKEAYEVIAAFIGKEKQPDKLVKTLIGSKKHPAEYIASCLEKGYLTFEEIGGETTYHVNKDELYASI